MISSHIYIYTICFKDAEMPRIYLLNTCVLCADLQRGHWKLPDMCMDQFRGVHALSSCCWSNTSLKKGWHHDSWTQQGLSHPFKDKYRKLPNDLSALLLCVACSLFFYLIHTEKIVFVWCAWRAGSCLAALQPQVKGLCPRFPVYTWGSWCGGMPCGAGMAFSTDGSQENYLHSTLIHPAAPDITNTLLIQESVRPLTDDNTETLYILVNSSAITWTFCKCLSS